MAHIAVLDESTVNQIAAGEVIERPASVAKELLENAMDAGATAVTAEIRDGGISLIRVTDNGCGIPKEEVATAFLPHATSKIRTADDLTRVASLGFRGEALSSIAAVAQVEVITKESVSLTGTRYLIEGGREKALEEIGAPEGTTFLVRNLFYNTPARKEFLKTPMTEGSHVAGMVEKLALSHPEVSVRFIQNGQSKLHTSGNRNLKDLAYTVFGRDICANLLPVEADLDGIAIRGFIGKPVIARGNRNYENYFINGRFIRSKLVSKAIEDAYRAFMMQHKYPFTLLYFTMDPQRMDVNIHPAKMELRFREEEQVYRDVLQCIGSALSRRELIPEVTLDQGEGPLGNAGERRWASGQTPPSLGGRMGHGPAIPPRPSIKDQLAVSKPSMQSKESPLSRPRMEGTRASDGKPDGRADGITASLPPASPTSSAEERGAGRVEPLRIEPFETRRRKQYEEGLYSQIPPLPPSQVTEGAGQLDLFAPKLLEPEARTRHKLIGQLFDTYWLVEYGQNLYIIDQHAAHEKVLFERTMKSIRERTQMSQAVAPPIILTLSPREEVLLNENMEYFTGMGFEIEPFGGKEYAVRGVPSNLFSLARKELLMEILDELGEGQLSGQPEMIYEKAASASCKAAVKGGNRLSAQEANELIDQLLKLDNPYACPHGRPTIISMSRHELEKKFKRIV